MWRGIRIAILLTVLVFVALGSIGDRLRTTDWDDTLWVGIFPINGDGQATTDRFIDALRVEQFADIEEFFSREAEDFGIPLERPVRVDLHPRVTELPPRLEPGASLPARIAWSLRTRYYTWSVAGDALADIRLFVLYHDPDHTEAVPHSLGLQQGLLGVVYAYADPVATATNNIVIAHELLHTLGATDKYDPATNLPLYPQGYGEPDAESRYPQQLAEIMAGRIAIDPDEAEMPPDLDYVVVGRETATEIGWLGR